MHTYWKYPITSREEIDRFEQDTAGIHAGPCETIYIIQTESKRYKTDRSNFLAKLEEALEQSRDLAAKPREASAIIRWSRGDPVEMDCDLYPRIDLPF